MVFGIMMKQGFCLRIETGYIACYAVLHRGAWKKESIDDVINLEFTIHVKPNATLESEINSFLVLAKTTYDAY